MDRMKFLQTLGITLGSGALLKQGLMGAAPADGQASAPRFRPASGGRIQVSRDGGRTWGLHAGFSEGHEVLQVRQEARGTYADLCFQGVHTFQLQLDASGKHWTV